KSGSWFSYGETKIGQGSEKVKAFLQENLEIKTEIEKQVKEILGLIKDEDDEDKTKK
ncbi:MAG: DNA recombination/repair protein RecA, partial [Candidatus Cloacimonadota bacterium]